MESGSSAARDYFPQARKARLRAFVSRAVIEMPREQNNSMPKLPPAPLLPPGPPSTSDLRKGKWKARVASSGVRALFMKVVSTYANEEGASRRAPGNAIEGKFSK